MLELTNKGYKQLKKQSLGEDYKKIQHIDLSCNQLSIGLELTPLINLVTLIIDDNHFSVLTDFPTLKKLQTFSANKNNFSDLYNFIEQGLQKFPKLKNISLLKNPMNPYFQGQQKYIIYRDRMLDNFSQLITMDGCSVTIMKKQMSSKSNLQQQQYQKLSGVGIYDKKYANNQFKSVKTKSEGHRFVRNNQL